MDMDMDMDFYTLAHTDLDMMLGVATCVIAFLVVKVSNCILYADAGEEEYSDMCEEEEYSDMWEESEEDSDEDSNEDWRQRVRLRNRVHKYMRGIEDCIVELLAKNGGMRQCDIGATLGIRGGYKENNKWSERDRVVAQVLRKMVENGYVEKVSARQPVYRLTH